MSEDRREPLLELSGLRTLTDALRYVRRAKLWLQVLIAMALGIGVGLLLSPETGILSESTAAALGQWIALPGKLFLAIIQMIVIPLILTSIVQGIASATDLNQLRTTGLWTTAFFLVTTALSVAVGIGLGLLIRPGSYVDLGIEAPTAPEPASPDAGVSLRDLPDKFTGLFPENPMGAIVEGDMLQIVVFAIIIGIGLLLRRNETSQPLIDLVGSVQEVSMGIVGLAMSFAPLAVFGLLAQSMIQTGAGVLLGLGVYSLSVVGAMLFLFVVYLLIAWVLGGKSPIVFLRAAREPALLGFSTNSSAATMPITVKSAEEGLAVPTSLAQFIVPLGATINMGGTACYQGLTTLFMAQLFGLELSVAALAALTVTAVGASIGTPAVPGVGIIVLSGVLASAGIPAAGLPLILGVDRILERFRTSLNVTGDLTACAVMSRRRSAEAEIAQPRNSSR